MNVEFSPTELEEIKEMLTQYPEKESAIKDILWLAQDKYGWVSPEIMEYVAKLLEITPSKVEGVVTFYTMFYKKPVGKYHIQVCTNVSCMLREGIKIYKYLSEKYNIGNMEVTSDGKFSLEEVECMGACGGAPMIALNKQYYENMTIEKIDELLNSLD